MKLLKADLFHWLRDRVLWALLGLTFLMPLLTSIMTNSISGDVKSSIETLVFKGLGTDILCVLIGVAVASFFGKEYQNNTIRNKVCYGEPKVKVAAIFLVESALVTLAFVLASLLGSFLFGAFFCTFEFSGGFLAKLFLQILILIAFSFTVSAVSIAAKSFKAGFIYVVIVSVMLGAVSHLFTVSAGQNEVFAVFSRLLYMTVSDMLVNSNDGVYAVRNYTFEGIYWNAALVAIAYSVISIGACLLIVRKHSYK